jgi:hypothetical protein
LSDLVDFARRIKFGGAANLRKSSGKLPANVSKWAGLVRLGDGGFRPNSGKHMNYLLLIYSNEAEEAALSESALKKITDEYVEFTKSIVQAGRFKAGDRLKPVSTASTVRVRNGKAAVTDGPFAETREQLGGYYMIEAKNLDEATAIAARVPGAQYGSIEVRPVWPMG